MELDRQHPFVSPLGCGAALLLILGVAVAVIVSGGEVFSPGRLSAQTGAVPALAVTGGFASHAAFEKDCGQCHAPFQAVAAARCDRCHLQVADERAGATGVHGNPKVGDVSRCQTCHSEHRGADFNMLTDSLKKFNHATVNFSLVLHVRDYAQQPLATQCAACHTGANYAAAMSTCTACHSAHDKAFMAGHTAAFGSQCLTCHDGVDKTKGFDHSQTKFPLEGRHAQLACAGCHKADVPVKDTPAQCAACHPEPPAHAGMFGADCAACHTPAAWSPARLNNVVFDHASTGFALVSHTKDYTGSAFTCRQCHQGATDFSQAGAAKFDQKVCLDCHTAADGQFMAGHTQQFGLDCLKCHDGSGSLKNFDHQVFFVLDGQHAALSCEKCHPGQKFKGTPKDCVGFHAEPKVHAGLFGTDCAACHSTAAWTPARLTQHTFPLDHGNQGPAPCATCHTVNYTTYTCYGCHAHVEAEIISRHAEENIRGDRLNDCVACHATGRREDN